MKLRCGRLIWPDVRAPMPRPWLERETFECLRSRILVAYKELISRSVCEGVYSQLKYEAAFIGCSVVPATESQGRCATPPPQSVAVIAESDR